MSNGRKLKPRLPDEDEARFRDELRRGCPGCGSRRVVGRFRGVWEFTLLCEAGCPSLTGSVGGFTGPRVGSI